jgi:hypothetical protein
MRTIAFTAFAVGALQLVAALLAGGPRWRRMLALLVALPNVAVAWAIPPEHTLVRALVTLGGAFGYLRLLEIAFAREDLAVRQRLWRAFALIDTGRLKYGRPSLDGVALLRSLSYGALAVASYWVSFEVAPTLTGPAHLLARLGGGLVFAYALTDSAYATGTWVLRAVGVVTYELHRAPILSRSVKEFWGERWNRTVNGMLFARTFRPLARRRLPRLGIMASFAVSGLFHAYLLLPALGVWAAFLWGSYFLVQGALVLFELAMGVGRWPTPLARVWVVAVMVGTSPMIVEPMLRTFDGR